MITHSRSTIGFKLAGGIQSQQHACRVIRRKPNRAIEITIFVTVTGTCVQSNEHDLGPCEYRVAYGNELRDAGT